MYWFPGICTNRGKAHAISTPRGLAVAVPLTVCTAPHGTFRPRAGGEPSFCLELGDSPTFDHCSECPYVSIKEELHPQGRVRIKKR